MRKKRVEEIQSAGDSIIFLSDAKIFTVEAVAKTHDVRILA